MYAGTTELAQDRDTGPQTDTELGCSCASGGQPGPGRRELPWRDRKALCVSATACGSSISSQPSRWASVGARDLAASRPHLKQQVSEHS